MDELANSLQVCLDSGAKKVLLPITLAADISTVPAEVIGCFNLIFYSSAKDAVYKALGVEWFSLKVKNVISDNKMTIIFLKFKIIQLNMNNYSI